MLVCFKKSTWNTEKRVWKTNKAVIENLAHPFSLFFTPSFLLSSLPPASRPRPIPASHRRPRYSFKFLFYFLICSLVLLLFLFALSLSNFFFSPDLDECVGNNHDCSKNGICTNTHGSYKCHCTSGYSGDGRSCAGIALRDLPSLKLSL